MGIPDINKEISSEVQEQIDKRISDPFIQAGHNICKPYVCILCDIFVKPKELQLTSTKKLLTSTKKLLKHSSILDKNRYLDMSESLKNCYTFKDIDQLEIDLDTKHQIQDLILSPRSTYIKKSNREKGFVICQSCNYLYCKGKLPHISIANNFFWNSTRMFDKLDRY